MEHRTEPSTEHVQRYHHKIERRVTVAVLLEEEEAQHVYSESHQRKHGIEARRSNIHVDSNQQNFEVVVVTNQGDWELESLDKKASRESMNETEEREYLRGTLRAPGENLTSTSEQQPRDSVKVSLDTIRGQGDCRDDGRNASENGLSCKIRLNQEELSANIEQLRGSENVNQDNSKDSKCITVGDINQKHSNDSESGLLETTHKSKNVILDNCCDIESETGQSFDYTTSFNENNFVGHSSQIQANHSQVASSQVEAKPKEALSQVQTSQLQEALRLRQVQTSQLQEALSKVQTIQLQETLRQVQASQLQEALGQVQASQLQEALGQVQASQPKLASGQIQASQPKVSSGQVKASKSQEASSQEQPEQEHVLSDSAKDKVSPFTIPSLSAHVEQELYLQVSTPGPVSAEASSQMFHKSTAKTVRGPNKDESDRHADRESDRQTDRQADRQAYLQVRTDTFSEMREPGSEMGGGETICSEQLRQKREMKVQSRSIYCVLDPGAVSNTSVETGEQCEEVSINQNPSLMSVSSTDDIVRESSVGLNVSGLLCNMSLKPHRELDVESKLISGRSDQGGERSPEESCIQASVKQLEAPLAASCYAGETSLGESASFRQTISAGCAPPEKNPTEEERLGKLNSSTSVEDVTDSKVSRTADPRADCMPLQNEGMIFTENCKQNSNLKSSQMREDNINEDCTDRSAEDFSQSGKKSKTDIGADRKSKADIGADKKTETDIDAYNKSETDIIGASRKSEADIEAYKKSQADIGADKKTETDIGAYRSLDTVLTDPQQGLKAKRDFISINRDHDESIPAHNRIETSVDGDVNDPYETLSAVDSSLIESIESIDSGFQGKLIESIESMDQRVKETLSKSMETVESIDAGVQGNLTESTIDQEIQGKLIESLELINSGINGKSDLRSVKRQPECGESPEWIHTEDSVDGFSDISEAFATGGETGSETHSKISNESENWAVEKALNSEQRIYTDNNFKDIYRDISTSDVPHVTVTSEAVDAEWRGRLNDSQRPKLWKEFDAQYKNITGYMQKAEDDLLDIETVYHCNDDDDDDDDMKNRREIEAVNTSHLSMKPLLSLDKREVLERDFEEELELLEIQMKDFEKTGGELKTGSRDDDLIKEIDVMLTSVHEQIENLKNRKSKMSKRSPPGRLSRTWINSQPLLWTTSHFGSKLSGLAGACRESCPVQVLMILLLGAASIVPVREQNLRF